MTTHSSRTLSVAIARLPDDVYTFVSNPRNLATWATSFCRAVTRSPEGWLAETQDGPVSFRFVPANPFGVLDHYVTLGSGQEIYSPMRVVPNGDGSELSFTLFRLNGVADDQFARDIGLVERDLKTLKGLMEA